MFHDFLISSVPIAYVIATRVSSPLKRHEAKIYIGICAATLAYALSIYTTMFITFANWPADRYYALVRSVAEKIFSLLCAVTLLSIYRVWTKRDPSTKKQPNQAPEPITHGVTPPAAQEPRHRE